MVEVTIRSSYFKVYYLKKFSEHIATLIKCQTGATPEGESDEMEFDLPYFTSMQVRHCYFFKDKYFFFYCEKYCERFHLTKRSSIFDGEIKQLRKFVEYIIDNKHEAFDYPDNNVLMYSVTWEEDLLKENFDIVEEEKIFFPATTN